MCLIRRNITKMDLDILGLNLGLAFRKIIKFLGIYQNNAENIFLKPPG